MSDWTQITCRVEGAAIPTAVETFEALDALAVTQLNAGEEDYFDLAHPAEPGWRKQRVVGLFSDAMDVATIVDALRQALPLSALIESDVLPDQDWENTWVDQYQPIRINDSLWICPSWLEAPDHSATTILINPGLAFGTGTHPTTALCLAALSDIGCRNKRVLDFGCGSGILAIGAIKLGAKLAVGIDVDPIAESVSKENAALNEVSDQLTIQQATDLSGQTFDIVVANILAGALIELAPQMNSFLAPGGRLLLSGILRQQVDQVVDAYQHYFDAGLIVANYNQTGDWALITVRKERRGS